MKKLFYITTQENFKPVETWYEIKAKNKVDAVIKFLKYHKKKFTRKFFRYDFNKILVKEHKN